MRSSFKNIYEVRKSLRFELLPKTLNRKYKKENIDNLEEFLKSFYENYKDFIIRFGELLGRKEMEEENNKIYDFDWNNTLRFSYKWLEECFLNDWIKNQRYIKYNKNGKKKQQNYTTFVDIHNTYSFKIFKTPKKFLLL